MVECLSFGSLVFHSLSANHVQHLKINRVMNVPFSKGTLCFTQFFPMFYFKKLEGIFFPFKSESPFCAQESIQKHTHTLAEHPRRSDASSLADVLVLFHLLITFSLCLPPKENINSLLWERGKERRKEDGKIANRE